MTQANQERNKWDSINIRVNTPAGTAFVTILEDQPGKIYKIFFQIGKAGSEINALCSALAEMASDLLQTRSLSEVIVHLSGITTDRSVKAGAYDVKSTPAALMLALMQYRAGLPNDPTLKRPARMGRRVR